MREVLISDVTAAARVLMKVPAPLRNDLCMQMLVEADWADKYARRLNKPHRQWGSGTLMAVTRGRELASERSFFDPEYTACFMTVLRCLECHRAAKTCKSKLHSHMRNELHHGFAFG